MMVVDELKLYIPYTSPVDVEEEVKDILPVEFCDPMILSFAFNRPEPR